MKTVNILVGACLRITSGTNPSNEIMLNDREGVVYIGKIDTQSFVHKPVSGTERVDDCRLQGDTRWVMDKIESPLEST